MKINEMELVKLCKLLYPYVFDYKDIKLNELNIKIDEYLHVNANLSYYNVETKLQAIARIRVDNQIIVDIKGLIKYGFINLDLNKVLKEIIKDNPYVTIDDEGIKIENHYLKDIQLNDGYIKIELK